MEENQKEEIYLKKALELYDRERLAGFPDEAQLQTITFSADFERRMKRMISGQNQQHRLVPFLNSISRRVACFLVAVLGISFAVFGVRAAADSSFLLTVRETFSMLIFPAAETSGQERWSPSFLPDGFALAQQIDSQEGFYFLYRNSSGGYFSIEQVLFKNAIHQIDTEGAVTEQVLVNGQSGLFVQGDSGNLLVWNNAENTFLMTGNLPFGDLLQIAESLQKR
ncbi:MAG: DUF4367 domain-containing protein [Acutalibacteraceae bacterium]